MKLNKKTLVVSTATLTLAASAVFAWGYIGEGGGSVSTVSYEAIEFRLAGPVDNIDQGEGNAVEIPLEYKNPNPSDVSGMDIVAEVTGTSDPDGCPVMLDVNGDGTPETDTFHTANGSETIFTGDNDWHEIQTGATPFGNPTIYADDNAPDTCQGVDLDIEFSLTTT
jgi:hypothetical protein